VMTNIGSNAKSNAEIINSDNIFFIIEISP